MDPAQNSTSSCDPRKHEEEVAKLAYHFYQERGSVDGHHDEDWQRAEEYFNRLRNGDSSRENSVP